MEGLKDDGREGHGIARFMVGFPGSRILAAAPSVCSRLLAMSLRSVIVGSKSGKRGVETMMSMSPKSGLPGASMGEPTCW